MSAILQKWSRNVTFGTGAPDHYHNGLPFEADGSLAVQNGGAIDRYSNGLPLTAVGRVCVELNGGVHYRGSGAATFSVGGRLLVGQ